MLSFFLSLPLPATTKVLMEMYRKKLQLFDFSNKVLQYFFCITK
jgi:hypothetical protein